MDWRSTGCARCCSESNRRGGEARVRATAARLGLERAPSLTTCGHERHCAAVPASRRRQCGVARAPEGTGWPASLTRLPNTAQLTEERRLDDQMVKRTKRREDPSGGSCGMHIAGHRASQPPSAPQVQHWQVPPYCPQLQPPSPGPAVEQASRSPSHAGG